MYTISYSDHIQRQFLSLCSAPCWSMNKVPSPNLTGTALNTTLLLSLCHSSVSSFTCSLHLHFAWRWLPCRLCGCWVILFAEGYIGCISCQWRPNDHVMPSSNQAEIYSCQPVVGSHSNALGDTSPYASVPSQIGATKLSLMATGSIFFVFFLFCFSFSVNDLVHWWITHVLSTR